MTAIAGVWQWNGNPIARDRVERIQRAQVFYGPDHAAQWNGGAVALARHLLRLLPEDRFDRQPLTGGGGRFVLVADVRLDNREELAEGLGLAGDEAAVLCDAAFVLRAWERWGADAVHRLAGDYAFAVWDDRDRRLFLARDHLGRRPLHFHAGDGWFAFASMPKGLLALPEVPTGPDRQTLLEAVVFMPELHPRSFYAGVGRLPMGHRAWVEADGRFRLERYWHPSDIAVRPSSSPQDDAEGLREVLDRAVRAHLRGVGAVGSHLSSGFDSTAVTTTAARLLGAGGRGLHAFTAVPRVGFSGPVPLTRHGDEGPVAARTAAGWPAITHHSVATEPGDFTEIFARWHYAMDRPLTNALNMVWLDGIARRAKSLGVRVMLEAGWGNMTISYSGLYALSGLVEQGRLVAAARLFRRLARHDRRLFPLYLVAQTVGPFLPAPLWRAVHRLTGRSIPYLSDGMAINPARLREWRAVFARHRIGEVFRPPRNEGFRGQALTSADYGTMTKAQHGLFGIDTRDPTAALAVVRYCFSLPPGAWCPDGRVRGLFRQAFADRVPEEVFTLPTHGLQAADWRDSLNDSRESVRALVERAGAIGEAADILDIDGLRRLAESLSPSTLLSTPSPVHYSAKLPRALACIDFIARAKGGNT